MELFNPKSLNFNWAKHFRLAMILSTTITLLGALLILKPGFNYGIDFRGGTEAHVTFTQATDIKAVRETVEGKLTNVTVVNFEGGGTNEFLITAQGDSKEGVANVLRQALSGKFGNENESWKISQLGMVGPKVSSDLKKSAMLSLLYTCMLVAFYIFWRFDLRFAPGALACILHDLLVVSAVLVITGMEFDATVVAALLTLAGYSINDTVVIFDRIREIEPKLLGRTPEQIINESINSTLSRTILTAGTTFGACVVLLLMGGPTLRAFSISLMVGIFVGTYSSIFVASPLYLFMTKRQQRLEAAAARA